MPHKVTKSFPKMQRHHLDTSPASHQTKNPQRVPHISTPWLSLLDDSNGLFGFRGAIAAATAAASS
jgi:hypothetical protein